MAVGITLIKQTHVKLQGDGAINEKNLILGKHVIWRGVTVHYSTFNILVVPLAFSCKIAFCSDGEKEAKSSSNVPHPHLLKNTLEAALQRGSSSVSSIVLQNLLMWLFEPYGKAKVLI